MKRFALPALFILVLAAGVACPPQEQSVTVNIPAPPATRTDDVVDTLHGVEVADPYRWLEDQEAQETREWIDAQNAYTDTVLEQLPGRDELRELFTRLTKIDSIGQPYETGGRYFYVRRGADQDLYVYYYRDGLDGEEHVLLDPHGLSADHTTSVGLQDISKDGSLVVYNIRKGGVDEVSIKIRKVDTGEDLDFELPIKRYFNATLSPDNSYLIYTAYSDAGPRTMYHRMGTPVSEDAVIFGEEYGPEIISFATISPNGKWFLAMVRHGSASGQDIFIRPSGPEGEWKAVIADGVSRSSASFAGDTLVISTNLDAPNRRVVLADAPNPGVENWTEFLPEREDAVLQGVSPLGGYLVASYLKDVIDEVHIYDMEGAHVRDVSFNTIGSIGGGNGRWDSNEVFFTFSSFHIPTTIYRYAMDSGEMTEWAKIEVPVDSAGMTVEQKWYESKDGTRVPMFIVHRKDIKMDGSHPTLLTGYGGFNDSSTPYFSSSAAAWVEMGGVYAVANIRGGGEFGEEWHKAGMLVNKQNVFDDFIAAAEFLISEGYTSAEHLGIEGGSNGGLLVGACMTQRPDLFGAVVCSYPLLDMIRYHKFMAGSYWAPEYGSSDDPDQFKYILAYSPYQNVKENTAYPATLFITGDGDTRVAPLHARKMTAMVQARNSGDAPILLRYHTKAGHSGGEPLSEQIENNVDTYSFLKWRLFPK